MRSFDSTVRRAAALALAVTLLVAALGPPSPVGVAAAPADPAARLQLVVKQVKIHDDRDRFGEGELGLDVRVWRCKEELPLPCSGQEYDLSAVADPIAQLHETFGAGSGDTVTLERVVPDQVAGFAVYAGQHYVVRFDMDDHDGAYSIEDQLGKVVHVVDIEEHGLGLGTHTKQSFNEEQYQLGDYTVTYEIRRAPLPDLRASNITLHDLPGSPKKLVCVGVQNIEVGDAGPFDVAVLIKGVESPGERASAGRLLSGDGGELCVEAQLPDSGRHVLRAVVDDRRQVTEFNETNNAYEHLYTAPAPAAAPAAAPAQADLTVAAIRVNGQATDGNDDCKDGKNTVAVLVKNAGAADAGASAVRLVVDGDDDEAKEKSVAELEAGREREVRFDDVRLKQGEHILTALADSKYAVAEAKEDNNELYVTARCKDDD